jgi:TolB protein
MDTDGSSVQLLPAKESDTGWVYPAWSPDGKKIAYADGVNNDVEVFVCDADGTNKKQMTTIGGINTLAAWSADGKKIAFQHFSNPQEPGALWTMDSDGTTQNQVIPTEAPLQGGRPAWKPAGPPCLARQ